MLAVASFACAGDGASGPPATPTPSSTPTAIRPFHTPTPLVVAPLATPTEAPRCRDPYPAGSPYVQEPGEPIRLRSTGSAGALSRYQPIPFHEDEALRRAVSQGLGAERRHVAVVIKNIADGSGIAIAPDRTYYAASLFKTWVMLEAFHQREQGTLGFGESYIVSDHYAGAFRLNPGELEMCSSVTVEDALAAMIRISDNVAANMMLDRVGSSNVNSTLAGLGMPASGFRRGLDLPTTAGEMALLLEAIGRGQAVSGPASMEMLALLLAQTINDRLPALLPPEASVAHKTGNWANATHDAGIVFSPGATYVIVVLTDYGYADASASRIASISRIAYDHYNSDGGRE